MMVLILWSTDALGGLWTWMGKKLQFYSH